MSRNTETWRKRQVKLIERAQDRCVNRAYDRTEAVLVGAANAVWDHYENTGFYARPSLNELRNIYADFYRHVLEESFAHAEAVKRRDKRPVKPVRLANKKGPTGIPRTLKDMVQVFGDRRYWPTILKRSRKQADKLRADYLRKLERRFKKLIPQVTSGKLSPEEARQVLQKEWGASKARVRTVFQTETTNYFAKTQTAYFNADPEIIGFLFDSVRDQARTKICVTRHGMVLRPGTKALADNTPACHFNCRSHLIPLANTKENREMMAERSRQPENRHLEPLPRGWRK